MRVGPQLASAKILQSFQYTAGDTPPHSPGSQSEVPSHLPLCCISATPFLIFNPFASAGRPRSTGPGSNWVKTWGWAFGRCREVAGRHRRRRDAAGKSNEARGADKTVCSLVGSDGNSVNSSIISMHRQGWVVLIRPVINPSVEPGPDPLAPPLQIDFIGLFQTFCFPPTNRIHSSIVSKVPSLIYRIIARWSFAIFCVRFGGT